MKTVRGLARGNECETKNLHYFFAAARFLRTFTITLRDTTDTYKKKNLYCHHTVVFTYTIIFVRLHVIEAAVYDIYIYQVCNETL